VEEEDMRRIHAWKLLLLFIPKAYRDGRWLLLQIIKAFHVF